MNARNFSRMFMVILIAFVFHFSSPTTQSANADIGWPPLNPAGSDLLIPPDFKTEVSMKSEQVVISIQDFPRALPQNATDSPGYWMRALVTANFQMVNTGSDIESYDVWFPLAATLRYPGLLPFFPGAIIDDFKVWINDSQVGFEQIAAPDLSDPNQESQWARFPMTFPVKTEVQVKVSYTIYPTGRRPFGGIEYILQTGAGWYGPIGEASILVEYPFPITGENVSLTGTSIEGLPLEPNPPGYVIEENTIRWHLNNFEPTEKDNVFVEVLEPDRYELLLDARGIAESQPDSYKAQLDLANASRDCLLTVKTLSQSGGSKDLAEKANQAYQRALEIDPTQPDTYIQYAKWMLSSYAFISIFRDGICPPELCDLVSNGLQRFPSNPDLIQIDESIQMTLDEMHPAITEIPTDPATITPALAISSTVIPSPISTKTTSLPTAKSDPVSTNVEESLSTRTRLDQPVHQIDTALILLIGFLVLVFVLLRVLKK